MFEKYPEIAVALFHENSGFDVHNDSHLKRILAILTNRWALA